MSEPIRLWDKSGALWITYSPSAAAAAIEAGTHTLEQPVTPDEEREITQVAQKYAAAFGVSAEHARMLIDDVMQQPVTPDDTQKVPVVTTGRARRRDKGDSGVL